MSIIYRTYFVCKPRTKRDIMYMSVVNCELIGSVFSKHALESRKIYGWLGIIKGSASGNGIG
jgi:hypothetical protein